MTKMTRIALGRTKESDSALQQLFKKALKLKQDEKKKRKMCKELTIAEAAEALYETIINESDVNNNDNFEDMDEDI